MRRSVVLVLFALAVLAFAHRHGDAAAPDAAPASVNVYVFWREGCPHCERALAWFSTIEASRGMALRVHRIEIGRDPKMRELLLDVVRDYRLDRAAVPLIVVGPTAFIGFLDADSSGREIEAAIRSCEISRCPDPLAGRLERESAAPEIAPGKAAESHPVPTRVRVPFFGDIETQGVSLLALTVTLAAADGFNPCAMWTLVFLLGLIGNMQDRLRMWTLGIAFVAASAAVYFLFMAAWLNVVLLLGMIVWLRWGIGALAIAGGVYSLRRGFSRAPLVCEVTAPASRRKVLDALRSMALEKRFVLALIGIVLIAVAVNLVELICSAGIPAVYTQVLALSEMTSLQYYAYLALYVAVFMLDDLVVLIATLGAITLTGTSERYTRWSNRVGGIILIGLGLLLLFRPELLVLH
jgi:cytochrome c biogenesis protein CcdA